MIDFDAFQRMPDGVVHELPESLHQLSVVKQGDYFHLVFFREITQEIQARLKLADPAFLVSPYTQAMMLSVVLKDAAANSHLVGFGGGRIPMTLRRFDPAMSITCTETDPAVVGVAEDYFGAEIDAAMHVHIGDGRDFLEKRRAEVPYDLILIDASDGTGPFPPKLCTQEFYGVCRANVASDGILACNLHQSDSRFFDKIATLSASFRSVNLLPVAGGQAVIVFASDAGFEPVSEVLDRAIRLDEVHGSYCPLAEHAARLQPIEEVEEYQSSLELASILTDSHI